MGSCAFTGGRRIRNRKSRGRRSRRHHRRGMTNDSLLGTVNATGNSAFHGIRRLGQRGMNAVRSIRKGLIGYR